MSLRESQNFPDIFVNCRDLADRGKLIKLERLASLQRIWLILDGYAERNLRQLIELLRHPNVSAIAIVYKKFDVFRILGNVDSCFHNKIYYHFPEHSHSKDSFLSCDEIFRFKNEIQRRFPWHDIRLIHFKQMSDKSLEFPRVKWEAPFSSESKRSLSLVVTNRNQGEFFKTALESWLRQSSELRPLVEIVVVNFERGENFIDELKEMLANFPDRSPNLTYLDLSQQASSVMSFAMKKEVARIARGRRILFVDSHLLPSPDFLKENVLRTDKKNEVFHFVQPYQSLPIEERRPCPWYERQLCSFLINREAFLSLPFDSSGYISAFFARIDFSYQLYCHQFLVVESEWKGTSSARLGYEDLSQGQSINNQPGAITDAKRFYCRYLDEKIYDRFFLLMGENHFLRLFVWWSFSQIKKSTMAVVLKWAAVGGEKVFAVIKSVLKWVEYYFLTSYGLRIVGIKLGVVLIKLRVLVIKAKYFILEGYHLGRRLYGWYLSSPRTYPLRKVYYFTRYQVIKWRQRLFVGAQLDD